MQRDALTLFFAIVAIILFIFLLALGPIFTVWSIQVLFRAETLELNFQSWCAALWIICMLNSIRIGTQKN